MEPDPRFTLANERTLLAWLRTSLGLVVAGLAITAATDLLANKVLTGSLATACCSLGLVVCVLAYRRWMEIERALRRRRPIPAPTAAPLLAGTLCVVAVTAAVAAALVVL
ncbi:DUF202 domain-containing protein [Micromonospora sp. DR5-3]|uniref:YidH family protein n=1 Tax=unclassified Micromonospora TaxID=2617518 RepID=UPI0016521585|nr:MULTISPECIES: DUF202 domain-containing protein [unclassified Micromonospora]MCW3820244.1 DUF202 domain-containing protein [Micromonospora sp. DR5-3]